MAWTQADVDQLKANMASGVLKMKHGDKETVFQNVADMQKLLLVMQQEVDAGGPQKARRTVAGYSSGLGWPSSRDWNY
jgi:hypothetical protein